MTGVDGPPTGSIVFIALHFSGTVVPKTLTSSAFWFFLIMHLVCCSLYAVGYLREDYLKLNPDDCRILVGITVFFEVFYTRQCCQRCERLWELTTMSFTHAYDIAFSMRQFIKKNGRPCDRVAFRWVVVCLLLSLMEARKKRAVTRTDLDLLVDMGLVRVPEISFLQDVTGHQRMVIMLHAAANLGRVGCETAGAAPDAAQTFYSAIMRLRHAQKDMQDLLKFPVPFGYVHLLSLMVCLCLAAQAYGMAMTGSIFAPFFYTLSSVVFIGMMGLASQLSDPFGDDDSDFPLSKWIHTFLKNVAPLIDYEHDGSLDDFVQEIEEEVMVPTEFGIAPMYVEDIFGRTPATK